jgi:cysteinyl-tRNA synthetase
LTPGQAAALLIWWQRINHVLQLQEEAASTPENVFALLGKRAEARAAKNWSESDSLRAEIEALGWFVKDTKDGQKLTKKSG